MKRLICVLMCGLMLMVSFSTLSETPKMYEEVFSFDSMSSPDEYGQFYFKVYDYRKSGKEGVLDQTGAIRIPAIYGDLSYLDHGYYEAMNESGDNNKALIDLDGSIRIPFEYADFKILSPQWVIGVKLAETKGEIHDYTNGFFGGGDKKYIVTQYDVYNLKKGDRIGTLNRSQYDSAKAFGDYLLVEDRNNGIQLYDSSLTPIVSAFEDFYDDEFYIKDEGLGKKSVSSRISGEAIAEGYRSVSTIKDSDLLIVRGTSNRSGYGLMDRAGTMVLDLDYDYIDSNNVGGYIRLEQDSKAGLFEISSGKVVVECLYDNLIRSNSQYLYVNEGYVCIEQNGKLGFADLNGNVTCEPRYAKAVSTVLGCSLFATDIDGSIVLVAADGTVTRDIAEIYDYTKGTGYFNVTKNNEGYWGVMDWHGNVVVPHTMEDSYSIKLYNDFMLFDGKTLYRLIRN